MFSQGSLKKHTLNILWTGTWRDDFAGMRHRSDSSEQKKPNWPNTPHVNYCTKQSNDAAWKQNQNQDVTRFKASSATLIMLIKTNCAATRCGAVPWCVSVELMECREDKGRFLLSNNSNPNKHTLQGGMTSWANCNQRWESNQRLIRCNAPRIDLPRQQEATWKALNETRSISGDV